MKITTHQSTVDQIDLAAVIDTISTHNTAYRCLKQIHRDHDKRETLDHPAFYQVYGDSHVSEYLAVKVSLSDNDLTKYRFTKNGRRHSITIFKDQSCIVIWQEKDSTTSYIVPWPFKLPTVYSVDADTSIDISTDFSIPRFTYDIKDYKTPAWSGNIPLIHPPHGVKETARVKALRKSYRARLRRDAVSIVDAFLAAPGVSIGPRALEATLQGEVAFPFFADIEPNKNDNLGRLLKDMLVYMNTAHPEQEFRELNLRGMAVKKDGYLTVPRPSILPDSDIGQQICDQIMRLLVQKNPYLSIADQVSQIEGIPRYLGGARLQDVGELSAHQRIEIVSRVKPLLGDPARAIDIISK